MAWKMPSYGSLWPGADREIAMPAATAAVRSSATPAAAVDDGVERDRGRERERREPEPELVVGDPRGADDEQDRDGPRTGAR